MKKYLSMLLPLVVVLGAAGNVAFGGGFRISKIPLKRVGPRKPATVRPHIPNTKKNGISKRTSRQHGSVVRLGTPTIGRGIPRVDSGLLPEQRFPQFSLKDKQLQKQVTSNLSKLGEQYALRQDPMIRSMRYEVFENSTVPYHRYIAQGLDYIFIGESHSPANHFTYPVQEEIIRIIETVKQQNPNRKIVVAFEHLFDTNDPAAEFGADTPLALASTDAEYAQIKRGNPFNLAVPDAVHEMGLEVLGLDPRYQLAKLVQRETGSPIADLFSDDYIDFSRSHVGFSYRHQAWVEHIETLRKQAGYEDSLVICVAGAAHMSKDGLFALSHMLKGKSSTFFVIEHSVAGDINPVLEEIASSFEPRVGQNPELDLTGKKVVVSFKPVNQNRSAAELEEYANMLGSDRVVLVPDINRK